MSAERHERVRAVFLEVAALDATDRARRLDVLCDGDESLRRDVMSLLAHDDGDEELLGTPLVEAEVLPRTMVMGMVSEFAPGTRVGRYTIEKLVGMGGMGVVYRARQDQPRRDVALKVIRVEMGSRGMLRRVEQEAELLGRLQHPGIAQIYEAGHVEVGVGRVPYFAMEFVDGASLTEHVRTRGLDTRARLEVMLGVCAAVEHAHQKGVIHRDLKPANILVDQSGQPKVLDFGIARAIDSDARVTTIHSDRGQLIGTLQYMSPEQVAGDSGAVDTRSDVYALGVIVFEVLCGRPPYEFGECAIAEAARIIRERPALSLGEVDRSLRGDLEVIVSRAMSQDPERRYQSAAGIAEDIRRHLAGMPIVARADSMFYVLKKRLNRSRGLVIASSVATVLLAGVSGIAVLRAREAREQRTAAVAERQWADQMRDVAARAATRAEASAEASKKQAYFASIGFAQAALHEGEAARARRVLDDCPEDLRGWEWRYLDRQCDTSVRRVPAFAEAVPVAHGVGGRVVISRPGEAAVIGAKEEDCVFVPIPNEAIGAAMIPGGELLACVGKERLSIVDRTGRVLREGACVHAAHVRDVDASGGRMLLVGAKRFVAMHDAESLREMWRIEGIGLVEAAVLSPDGALVYAGAADGTLVVLDAANGAVVRRLRCGNRGVRAIAFSPDGSLIAVGGLDGTIRVWAASAEGGQLAAMQSRPHSNKVMAMAWSPDGESIASGGTDTLVNIVNGATGDVERTFVGHTRTVSLVMYAESGELMSASMDGSVRMWSVDETRMDTARDVGRTLFECDLSGDGGLLIVAGAGGRVSALDAIKLETVREFQVSAKVILDAAVMGGAGRVAVATREGMVDVHRIDDGGVAHKLFAGTRPATDVAWCGAREWVLSVPGDGTVRAHAAADGAEMFVWKEEGFEPFAVACDGEGKRIGVGDTNGRVRVLDMETRATLHELSGLERGVWAMCFSPDGLSVFAGSDDGRAMRWPLNGGAPVVYVGHAGPVYCLALSPDGKRLVTGSFDNTVRMWDVETGTELLALRGHTSAVQGVCFSKDGARVYSCSDMGTVRCWDAALPPG